MAVFETCNKQHPLVIYTCTSSQLSKTFISSSFIIHNYGRPVVKGNFV